jgi:hypothetical protein
MRRDFLMKQLELLRWHSLSLWSLYLSSEWFWVRAGCAVTLLFAAYSTILFAEFQNFDLKGAAVDTIRCSEAAIVTHTVLNDGISLE